MEKYASMLMIEKAVRVKNAKNLHKFLNSNPKIFNETVKPLCNVATFQKCKNSKLRKKMLGKFVPTTRIRVNYHEKFLPVLWNKELNLLSVHDKHKIARSV